MKRNQLSALSIRLRLPLLICSLLLFVMLVFGYISYLGIRNASMKIGEERLQTLTEQLSTMFAASTGAQHSPIHQASRNPAVRQFLRTGGKDSVASARLVLERLQRDSTYVNAELIYNYRVLLRTNNSSTVFPVRGVLRSNGPDSARIGSMYLKNDSIFYPMIAPVYEGKTKLGDRITWRLLRATQKSLDDLAALLGTEARLYLGNADGTLWTDMVKPVTSPPVDNNNLE